MGRVEYGFSGNMCSGEWEFLYRLLWVLRYDKMWILNRRLRIEKLGFRMEMVSFEV